MKKLLLVVLALRLVLGVAAAAAAVVSGGASAQVPAPQAAQGASPQHWCDFVLAGMDATSDGSVLMGYNNDWSANSCTYVRVIPAPDPAKHQFVQLVNMGDCVEGGINEHQLAACHGVATDTSKAVSDADPYPELQRGLAAARLDI
jgi:dipeptidase